MTENYTVRRLRADEFDEAIELIWRTFKEFETPIYPAEGTRTFENDVVKSDLFRSRCESGEYPMWAAFDGEKIVAAVIMRRWVHFCCVFTDRNYHRKGIMTAMFDLIFSQIKEKLPEQEFITVNASPVGVPFYHRYGFVDDGAEKQENGIIYTQMKYYL